MIVHVCAELSNRLNGGFMECGKSAPSSNTHQIPHTCIGYIILHIILKNAWALAYFCTHSTSNTLEKIEKQASLETSCYTCSWSMHRLIAVVIGETYSLRW